LTVLYRPYWIDDETGTSHGTPYGYDSRVPLFLFGKGIAAGEYLESASPTDIAPTLAFLAGVTLPRVDGRVLTEGLSSDIRPARTSSAR
jgi:predicted AlkP superfamily pyrophosphatase or phosphodiesterase